MEIIIKELKGHNLTLHDCYLAFAHLSRKSLPNYSKSQEIYYGAQFGLHKARQADQIKLVMSIGEQLARDYVQNYESKENPDEWKVDLSCIHDGSGSANEKYAEFLFVRASSYVKPNLYNFDGDPLDPEEISLETGLKSDAEISLYGKPSKFLKTVKIVPTLKNVWVEK